MKHEDFIKTVAFIALMLNLVLTYCSINIHNEFKELNFQMDSIQNRCLKELVDVSIKTVDNQNQLMEYIKLKKEEQP